ncbi:MAG: right-handed parallel beta-helix repeat-containing protein, partial [Opitutales bacterium]|nr:right-handed parallel beta-helix repeat-containing protein [Opitutales bacterium]
MKKILSIFWISLLAATSYAADKVYMVSTYGDDSNNGLSWATAKRTIQAAMNLAESSDSIWVAEGTYYPTDNASNNTDKTLSFTTKNGVKMYGGFPKTGTPAMSNRDPSKYATILSGNIGDVNSSTDNSENVFTISDSNIDDLTVIDGFSIKAGSTNSMKISAGGPILRNIKFESSTTGLEYTSAKTTSLQNCYFNSLTNSYKLNSAGGLEISNSTFINCSGSQLNDSSSLSVTGSSFSNATIYKECKSQNTSISNCTFTNLTSRTGFLAQKYTDGKSTISNCSFTNSSYKLIYSNEITTVSNCTFENNSDTKGMTSLSTTVSMKKIDQSWASVDLSIGISGSGCFVMLDHENSIMRNCSFVNNKRIISLVSEQIKSRILSAHEQAISAAADKISSYSTGVIRIYQTVNLKGFSENKILKINGLLESSKFVNNEVSLQADDTLYLPHGEGVTYLDRYDVFFGEATYNFPAKNDIDSSIVFGNNLKISNCLFENNINNSGKLNFEISDFNSNITTTVYSENSSKFIKSSMVIAEDGTIINSTYVGNYSLSGPSAISSYNSKIRNCTFFENVTSQRYVVSTNGATDNAYKPQNCIFWDNMTSDGVGYENLDVSPVNSIVGQKYRDPSKDPKLLPLGDYGGPTETMPVSAGSSAIGKATVDSLVTTDQRGYTRSQTAPTIGACEYQNTVERINICADEQASTFALGYEFTLRGHTDSNVLEYIWYKNGVEVESNEDGSLTDSLSSGSAKYSVMAIYDGGLMESEEFTVSAGEPVIYVKTSGSDSNDGLTWNNAKKTISAAINAACYGSEIWIEKGTYSETVTLKNGIRLVGEFNGNETDKSQRTLPDTSFNTQNLQTKISKIANGIDYPRVTENAAIDGIYVDGTAEAKYSSFSIYNSFISGNLSMSRAWSENYIKFENSRLNGTNKFYDVSPIKMNSVWRGQLWFDNTNIKNRITENYHYELKGMGGNYMFSNVSNPYMTFSGTGNGNIINTSSDNVSFDAGNIGGAYIEITDSKNFAGDLNSTGSIAYVTVDKSTGTNINLNKSKISGAVNVKNSCDNTTINNWFGKKLIVSASNNNTFENIMVKDSDACGIELTNSAKNCITNAVVYNASSYGLKLSNSERTFLMNCSIYKNKGVGVYTTDTMNCAIYNSIVWGNSSSFSIPSSISDSWVIAYSDIQGGYANGISILNVYPRIIEVEDFERMPVYLGLLESSPVRGKGATQSEVLSSLTVPSKDIRGVSRSTPTALGAFEYIVPTSVASKEIEDIDVARGKYINYAFAATGGIRNYWIEATSNTGYPWKIMSGQTGTSYSRLATSSDKNANLYYGAVVLDADGGLNEMGYGKLSVFDLLYVRSNASGNKDGSSWANAYSDLATALNAAVSQSRIYVSAGTYPVNGANASNRDRKQAFALKNDVEVYGGFPATGEPEFEDRNPDANETILTADLSGNDADTDGDGLSDLSTKSENAYRVFFHPSSIALNSSAVLDGFTIRGGYDDATEEEYKSGAAMFNSASSPTIRNCVFVDNYSLNNGGAVVNQNSASPSFTDCDFLNNYAYYGGAICNVGSSPKISSSYFYNNKSKYNGGAIRNNSGSAAEISKCQFSLNSATNGGAVEAYESSPIIKSSTFAGNSASSSGGAVYAYTSSNPTIENCTFSENSAYFGGAIYARENSNAKIVHSTISGNSARYNGGALYSQNATPEVVNSILWGNVANTSGSEVYTSSSTPKITYSVVEGGYSGAGNTAENPKLDELADNGGEVYTMAVQSGSSAIEAAATGSNMPSTDARGVARSKTAPTIGAYEYSGLNINITIAQSEMYSGNSGTLTAQIPSGSPAATSYKWQVLQNDSWSDIPNSNSAQLTLENCVVQMPAYRVIVSFGSDNVASSEFTPVVRESANITSQPNSVEIDEGGNFTLSVSASGYGSLNYQWQKLSGGVWVDIEGATSNSYTVQNAPHSNSGQYRCKVSNGGATVYTNSANVQINAAVALYSLAVENGAGGGSFAEGEEVSITANAAPDGMVFDKWTGDVENVEDITSPSTTILMPARAVSIAVTYKELSGEDPFGEPVVYPNVQMTILGSVDFYGSPAPEGCVIGAFVNGELRGKTTVASFNNKAFVNLTLNVSANGEKVYFKIWNPAYDTVNEATEKCAATAESGEILGTIDSPYEIVFADEMLSLELALNSGWNQVSFNVELESMNIRSVFGEAIDDVALIQGNGKSFNPAWPDALNTLTSFDNVSGFWVKMNSANTLSLQGNALDVSGNAINLKAGWNNVGYTPSIAGEIRTVLASALASGKIERVINASGNFSPSTPDILNSLKEMQPGKGYWIKASENISIVFDEPAPVRAASMSLNSSPKKSAATLRSAGSDSFGEPVVYPNVQMTIIADVQIDGGAVPANSVVAAFAGGELRG